MRTIFIGILILFLLIACGAPASQMTVTSNVTVTSLPTATASATQTPSPTLAPTVMPTPAFPPEIISAIETSLPGMTVVGENLLWGGATVDGIKPIDLGNGKVAYERAPYEFSTPYGETIQMPATTIKSEEMSVEDGGLCIPAYCWEADANQWVRKKALAPDGITETEHPTYSKMEAMAMWLADTLEIESQNWQDANSPERVESEQRARSLLGNKIGTPKIDYGGMTFVEENGKFVWDSRVYVVDSNGEPVRDDSGNVMEKPMLFMSYVELKVNQSLMAWENVRGEKIEIMLDANLDDISYYEQHGTTPFVLTEEQYSAMVVSLTSAN